MPRHEAVVEDDDDYDEQQQQQHSSTLAPANNGIAKVAKGIHLSDYSNAGQLPDANGSTRSLIDQILEIWKPRTWFSSAETREVRSLLRTITPESVPSRQTFYRQCTRQLDEARAKGNALDWEPDSTYKGGLPTHVEIEAIRILGAPADGYGTFPTTMLKRLADARLDFLLEDPVNWSTFMDPFWAKRFEIDYPDLMRRTSGRSKPPPQPLDDSGFVGDPVPSDDGSQEHYDIYDIPSDDDEFPVNVDVKGAVRRKAASTKEVPMGDDELDLPGNEHDESDNQDTQYESAEIDAVINTIYNNDYFKSIVADTLKRVSLEAPTAEFTNAIFRSTDFQGQLTKFIDRRLKSVIDDNAQLHRDMDQLKKLVPGFKQNTASLQLLFGESSTIKRTLRSTVDNVVKVPSPASDGVPVGRTSTPGPSTRGSLQSRRNSSQSITDSVKGDGLQTSNQFRTRGSEKRPANASPSADKRLSKKMVQDD